MSNPGPSIHGTTTPGSTSGRPTAGTDPARRAEALRRRARSLRTLADQLSDAAAMRLAEHAGPDTWHSPRADLCRWVLGVNQAQLGRCLDELRWSAHRLEREASEIEAAAALEAANAGAGVVTTMAGAWRSVVR